jgi:hypothetical protein
MLMYSLVNMFLRKPKKGKCKSISLLKLSEYNSNEGYLLPSFGHV